MPPTKQPQAITTDTGITTPEDLERERARKRILNRLRRARGQLDAVIRAVEDERSCREVVTQLSAVNSAIQRAGFTVISQAMKECVHDEDNGTDIAELEKLFLSLA